MKFHQRIFKTHLSLTAEIKGSLIPKHSTTKSKQSSKENKFSAGIIKQLQSKKIPFIKQPSFVKLNSWLPHNLGTLSTEKPTMYISV